MRWFDTKEIKNKETLSEEQISYLLKPSFAVWGPFNVLIRRHWDFLLVNIFMGLVDKIISFDDSTNSTILAFVILGFYAWFAYFTIAHGRRLAWNRNKWDDFQHFKESERKWTPWGITFFGVTILVFAGAFLKGYLE